MNKNIFQSIKNRCINSNLKPISDGIVESGPSLSTAEMIGLIHLEESIKEINVVDIQEDIITIKTTISLINDLSASLQALQSNVNVLTSNYQELQNIVLKNKENIETITETVFPPEEPVEP